LLVTVAVLAVVGCACAFLSRNRYRLPSRISVPLRLLNLDSRSANMFVLRNVGKYIFGSSTQEALIELPQGELHLVRPLSPKGRLEQIFRDSAIRIRRTTQDFNYQLVVQRAFEEGEAELEDEEAEIDALASELEEKTFLLDEALHLRAELTEDGSRLLVWRDLSGDLGDLYQFRCDASITDLQVQQFLRAAQECQYERKYRKPNTTASQEDLAQFQFDDESFIPQPESSELTHPDGSAQLVNQTTDDMGSGYAANTRAQRQPATAAPQAVDIGSQGTSTLLDIPSTHEIYVQSSAELFEYDPIKGVFDKPDAIRKRNAGHDDSAASSGETTDDVVATVAREHSPSAKKGKETWNFWLQIDGAEKTLVLTPCVADMSPIFDFSFLSFVFNHIDTDGAAKSKLLRFQSQPALEKFQQGIMQAIWEKQNEQKWEGVKETDQEYILDSFKDLNMEDADEAELRRLQEEEAAAEEEEEAEDASQSDEYDSEDEQPETKGDGEFNSQLAVGYKHDRSFVVRGNKIGVFTHTPNDRLKFSTNISKVVTPKGKLMNPKKVMLHSEDRDLILQNDVDPNKLYRMDLEYGKVVDEWKVHDDLPVVTFAPKDKFAQMTGEQTFVGVSNNALFKVDPRLSGNKIVDSEMKMYKGRSNEFSSMATTSKGHLAVASSKGDIRLYDRLGITAKAHLPSLGDPIIGMDVSADGRWILGTTKTYLLLIDAMQESGKTGFEKRFEGNSKPQPRRLGLTNVHIAQVFHETGQGVSFTPAKFNAGEGAEETSIITATGVYIIEWNLKRILRGLEPSYKIKRYQEEVKADDFKFGSDKNVIVALPNEVNMVSKQSFKKPNRESIMGVLPTSNRRSSGRIGTQQSGAYKLGRDTIVESPY
jgi:hypothetical protein